MAKFEFAIDRFAISSPEEKPHAQGSPKGIDVCVAKGRLLDLLQSLGTNRIHWCIGKAEAS
eukprot:4614940-Amphidinium_carterae.1